MLTNLETMFYQKRCIMNCTVNNDSLTWNVCPADLRKIQLALSFDYKERFKALKACYEAFVEEDDNHDHEASVQHVSQDHVMWKKEIKWIDEYLKRLG